MHHNNPEEFIGIDVGGVRIGLARGSSAARLAQPLKTVSANEAIEEIIAAVQENHTDGIVVGLPRALDGRETAQTAVVKKWADRARAKINLPFYWQDEAMTSKLAERQVASKAGPDAVAAAIILQDFLDTPKEQRVRC